MVVTTATIILWYKYTIIFNHLLSSSMIVTIDNDGSCIDTPGLSALITATKVSLVDSYTKLFTIDIELVT